MLEAAWDGGEDLDTGLPAWPLPRWLPHAMPRIKEHDIQLSMVPSVSVVATAPGSFATAASFVLAHYTSIATRHGPRSLRLGNFVGNFEIHIFTFSIEQAKQVKTWKAAALFLSAPSLVAPRGPPRPPSHAAAAWPPAGQSPAG